MQRDDELTPQDGESKPEKPASGTPRRRPPAKGAGTPRASARVRKPAAAASEEQGSASGAAPRPSPRMLARYRQDIRPTLVREFGYTSPMQAPALEKIVLNMGLGEALTNGRALETAPQQLAVIAGQRPVITKARRSVASFKVREGQSIGCAVTLRGRRMWEFLDRFINLPLPRIRDFRGLSRRSFDGKGNYSMGIREQIIFPEIDYNNLDRIRGLQVTIGTTAESDREGFRLLELLGMPFVREGQVR